MKNKTDKKLDTEKMLWEIDALVNTEFCSEMEMKQVSEYEYTQKEAKEMARRLAKVYAISHCIHCKACRYKYDKEED